MAPSSLRTLSRLLPHQQSALLALSSRPLLTQPPVRPHLALAQLLLRRPYSAFTPNPNPQPSFPDPFSPSNDKPPPKDDKEKKKGGMLGIPSMTNSPALDAALATFVGLVLVFGSGIAYLAWYKVSLRSLYRASVCKGAEEGNRQERQEGRGRC